MILSLKIGCIALYVLALAGLAGILQGALATTVEVVAAIVLCLHTLEVVLMYSKVRLYRGPLLISILLTILFGLLHWKPLADHAKA